MNLFEDTTPKPLKQLLGEIDPCEAALPDFQRDFVWELSATQELIVSIASNYPAGSLLHMRNTQARLEWRSFKSFFVLIICLLEQILLSYAMISRASSSGGQRRSGERFSGSPVPAAPQNSSARKLRESKSRLFCRYHEFSRSVALCRSERAYWCLL